MTTSPPIRCAHTRLIPTAEAMALRRPDNPNLHPSEQLRILGKIILAPGWRSPVVISRRSGRMTKGHGRTEAAALAGIEFVPIDDQDYDSDEQELADVLADNFIAEMSEIDPVLAKEIAEALSATPDFDPEIAGLTNEAFAELTAPPVPPADPRKTLAERFGIPPFSVLDARQGYWQDRKRAWLALGIQSEIGRGGGQ